MKSIRLLSGTLFALAVFSSQAYANITYDLSLGPAAVGTITTDGSTGVLQTSNIIDFNLTLTTATLTTSILGPLSGANFTQFGTDNQLNSTAFTATLTSLFFNFNAVGGTPYLIFQSGGGLLCFNGAVGNCSGNPASLKVGVGAEQIVTVEAGNVEIATVAVAGAVPEPSTWAMMILGFAGVGFMAYRRRNQTASLAA